MSNVCDEVEVQVGEILEFAAVDDQAVSAFGQVEFLDELLGCGVEIRQKRNISHRVERAEGGNRLFRHEQDMQRVSRLRMVKRQQRGGLA